MTGILAIDTATDACSVAVHRDGELHEAFELAPRRHNQRVFQLLSDLLSGGDLAAQGIDAIAYGSGPGSFTGLRIAASVVQGLAYANRLPCVPVSTLLTQVQGAYRGGLIGPGDTVMSTLDAKIGELYWGIAQVAEGRAMFCSGPFVSKPAELVLPQQPDRLVSIGDGLVHLAAMPAPVRARLHPATGECTPRAGRHDPPCAPIFLRGADPVARGRQPGLCPRRDQLGRNWTSRVVVDARRRTTAGCTAADAGPRGAAR